MVGSRMLIALVVSLFTIASTSAFAQESLVTNDSVGETFNGSTASAQLVYGEGYEAVFDIPQAWIGQFGLEILGVQAALFEGQDPAKEYCARFHVDVFEEPAGSAQASGCGAGLIITPPPNIKDVGTPIYAMSQDPSVSNIGFEVRGQPRMGQASLTELRFSAINNNPQLMVTINPVVTTTTRVRVRIIPIDNACQAPMGQEPPVLLSDADGISAPLKNFLYGYYEDLNLSTGMLDRCPMTGKLSFVWEDFGNTQAFPTTTPGDWVMRLIVAHDDGMGMVDMGGGTMDMGSMDMGGTMDMGGMMDMGPMDMGGGNMDMGATEDFGMAGMDSGNNADSGSGNNTTGNNNNGNNTTGNNTTGNNGTGGGLTITSVTPNSGPTTSSTNIVILGTGFEAGAEVLLGAENIGVTETETGRIRATVPEGFAVGTYDVIVTNPDGANAILMGAFEVVAASGDSASGAEDGCGCASGAGGASGSLILLLVAFIGARIRRRS